MSELEALLRAAREPTHAAADGRDEPDVRAPTDHALYLTAAMTGLREGELVALRWRDVDWSASVIRVRRSYTRGQLGSPKSKRSSRAVPMAGRLGGELDRHFTRLLYQGDDHLVFCHPQTGEPYDASQIRKRFYAAMDAAGMGHRCGREGGITFHSRAACRRSATQDESELSIRSTSPCTRSIASAMSLTGKSYSSANWL